MYFWSLIEWIDLRGVVYSKLTIHRLSPLSLAVSIACCLKRSKFKLKIVKKNISWTPMDCREFIETIIPAEVG